MLHAWVVPGLENRLGRFADILSTMCPTRFGTPGIVCCPDDALGLVVDPSASRVDEPIGAGEAPASGQPHRLALTDPAGIAVCSTAATIRRTVDTGPATTTCSTLRTWETLPTFSPAGLKMPICAPM